MQEDRIFEILTELKQHAAVTNEKLDWYNKSLDTHIKRTELLEARQDEFEKQTNKQLEVAILPIKSIKWIAGALAAIVAIASAFKDIIFK